MNDYVKQRVIEIANYVIQSKNTIREAAKEFGISKSTVHKDLVERLPLISQDLTDKVRVVLDEHIATRHIKGGLATRFRYKLLKQKECDECND